MKKMMGFISLILLVIILLSVWTSNSSYTNKNTALMVVLDPGHGGKDGGATGASGQYEKNFTLSVAKKIQKLLEKEPRIEVFMTRTDDSYISQKSRHRPEYANELGADLFLSIHGNTFSDPTVTGTETFYYHKTSRDFAKLIQKHVVEATGFNDRGIMKKDLFVIKDTKMPAALIEIGYLTNPQDESKMWTDEFQNQVATSIVEAILEYEVNSEKQGNKKWVGFFDHFPW